MLGQVAEGMLWMGTFHSISVKILRRNAELVGLKSNFTILIQMTNCGYSSSYSS